MKASWLLETDVFHENLERLVGEIERQGMVVKIASYVPYEDEKGYLGLFDKDACVVYYGSINFAAQVVREAPWVPGVYYTRKNYECTSYYPALAEFLLNDEYIMLPYGDLKRQKEFLYSHLGQDDAVFIRPNTGSKIFTGGLVFKERYEKDVDYLGFYGAPPDELCVASTPKNVEDEWRFLVADGEVVTGSQYISGGKTDVRPGYPDEALALARRVAGKGYQPDRVWCVDVCRTRAGNYYLLEIGAFSCAGLYACDLGAVVREVSRAAVEDWKDINEKPGG